MVEEELEEDYEEIIKKHLAYFLGTGWKISNINIRDNETSFTVTISNKREDNDGSTDYNS